MPLPRICDISFQNIFTTNIARKKVHFTNVYFIAKKTYLRATVTQNLILQKFFELLHYQTSIHLFYLIFCDDFIFIKVKYHAKGPFIRSRVRHFTSRQIGIHTTNNLFTPALDIKQFGTSDFKTYVADYISYYIMST